MGPGSNSTRTVVEVVVHLWPLTIFVPAILALILVLVVVTHAWDARDEARAAERSASVAGAVARPTGPALPRAGGDGSRRWGRRTRCDCSWHTVGVAVGVLSPPPTRKPSRADAT